MKHSSDNIHTHSVIRVFNEEKLHSKTAVMSNTDEYGVNQTMHNNLGLSLEQETINCIMSITNVSCFHNPSLVPILHVQSKGGLQLAEFPFG